MPPVDTKKDWFPKKSSGRLYVIYRVGGMYMGRAANTARVVTLKVVDGDAEGPSRIVRHPLPLQVVARLRQEIVAGEWAPGERVTEQLLTERYGVSRTPLREALKTVEAEGLLVLLPNRGAVITEPTLEDTEDKLRVLGTLEVMAAGLACLRASNAEIAALEKLHKRMKKGEWVGGTPTHSPFLFEISSPPTSSCQRIVKAPESEWAVTPISLSCSMTSWGG